MKGRSAIRLARLQQALAGGGTLHLSEAARLCGVSEMTIRRDVAASDGALIFLGGRLVMADNPRYAPVYNVDEQQASRFSTKRRLCERAAGFVENGDTLFIDCGTTLLPLVGLLGGYRELTVATYALNVANAVSQLPHLRLILLGGLYYPASQSFGSDDIAASIHRLGINRAFVSAGGVHAERGVSCFHFHEVAPKQAAIACAAQRLLVVDESKIGQIRPAYFAKLDDFDVVITDGDMAPSPENDGPRIVAA
ncbi:DeoR/GlpR transcriptional regulator [Billgrantia pellis]|uniref:DeoR/GlpR transcriptional regulator n=1 Tax=Billgrantia pellis TaxID=2606936 RepID=A0A7V7FY41_9GAMM|nr:DeoR/GlpR family DNA-binding transcription regulator [Halomonas pellis]KAA0010301.1 DeoR/GlpR transcriptional regulator [Halomonas pellis]